MNSYNEAQRLRGRLAASINSDDIDILGVQTQARVVPLSYSSHVRGWHPVRHGHGAIAFESKLESRFITWVAHMPELATIVSQPITVNYRHAGVRCRYTPDFLVELSAVTPELAAFGFRGRTLIEVKPLNRAVNAETKLSHQFAAARLASGHAIVLMTNVDLSPVVWEARHVA